VGVLRISVTPFVRHHVVSIKVWAVIGGNTIPISIRTLVVYKQNAMHRRTQAIVRITAECRRHEVVLLSGKQIEIVDGIAANAARWKWPEVGFAFMFDGKGRIKVRCIDGAIERTMSQRNSIENSSFQGVDPNLRTRVSSVC